MRTTHKAGDEEKWRRTLDETIGRSWWPLDFGCFGFETGSLILFLTQGKRKKEKKKKGTANKARIVQLSLSGAGTDSLTPTPVIVLLGVDFKDRSFDFPILRWLIFLSRPGGWLRIFLFVLVCRPPLIGKRILFFFFSCVSIDWIALTNTRLSLI